MKKPTLHATAGLVLAGGLLFAPPLCAETIISPDGNIQVIVNPDATGRLTYEVKRQTAAVILPSAMGITVNGADLGLNAVPGTATIRTINENYPLYGGHSTAVNHCNEAVIPVTGGPASTPWVLEVRVFNDGVGYRYRVPGNETRTINGEATQWKLPADGVIHYQDAGNNDYESVFGIGEAVSSLTLNREIRPTATVVLPGPLYVMMTEANLVDYSDMSLRYAGGLSFQALFKHSRTGWSHTGEIVSPWRTTIVVPDLDRLVNTDILTNLCPAPNHPELINSPSWIKPGRSTWHWMVSGRPVYSAQTQWVDWTSQCGLEYYMIDDGWKNWTSGGLDAWGCMKAVVDYAATKGVKIWAWVDTNEVTTPAQRLAYFAKVRETGIVGLKIDFMGDPDPGWVKWYDDTLRDAATHRLMVNFHGCVKPSGRNRTYPHELTREGILGREFGAPGPVHDTTLPFTRFVQGHGDYTPTDFRGNKLSGNSYAHELAQAVVYTSPFLCYGGDPQNYLANPSIDILKTIPSTWDETRVLPGSDLGGVAGFARRKDSVWFVGVINGSTARNFPLNLGFIGAGSYVIDKLGDSGTRNDEWVRTRETVNSGHSFSTDMRARGGFVARIVPTSLLPATVAGVTASGNAGSIQVGWVSVPGATGYKVGRATAPAGPFTTVAASVTGLSFTDTSVRAGATYHYVVTAMNDYGSGSTSTSASGTATGTGLPAVWADADIGNPAGAGYATFNNGLFTVNGGGNDIWGGNDSFHYTYQNWSGDGVLTARVVSSDNTAPWAKVGLMFRETLANNSKYSFAVVTPSNGAAFQLRMASGSVNTNTAYVPTPYWVRIERIGNSFSMWSSADGITWTQVGATTSNAMNANLYAGLAVCSHAGATLNTTRFDNVSFTGPNAGGIPASVPAPFTSGDIGPAGATGSASFANGVYTVNGSGSDIWGSADGLHFVSQQISGDCDIRTRITAVQNTHPWAKVGLMLRETLNANSAYAMNLLTPADGMAFQRRGATGAAADMVSQITGKSAPVWARLVRAGNSITAYHSTDGNIWTPMGTTTVTMGATVYAGLAVCSHSNGTLNTTTFDNFSLVSLPSPWESVDIGTVMAAGSAKLIDSTYTVMGSGGDIWGTADAFRFTWQAATGDCEIITRVSSISPTDPAAKTGVMMRESLSANSMFAMVNVSPRGTLEFLQRQTTGASASAVSRVNGIYAPAWVRLARTGNTFSGFYSLNGTTWTPLGTTAIAMGASLSMGIPVTSHAAGTLCTGAHDNLTVTP